MKSIFLFSIIAVFLVVPSLTHAEKSDSDIIIERFSGSIKVVAPDGEESLLEQGLPVSDIIPGSEVEVLTGTAVLNVQGIRISMVSGSAVGIYDLMRARGRFSLKALRGETVIFAGLAKITMSEGADIIIRINPRTLRVTLLVKSGQIKVEEDGRETIVGQNGMHNITLPEPPPGAPTMPVDIPDIPDNPEPIEASPFMP